MSQRRTSFDYSIETIIPVSPPSALELVGGLHTLHGTYPAFVGSFSFLCCPVL
jgi:hypothetical protein